MATVLARSPGLNGPHTSPIQDMVNQIGKRSNWWRDFRTAQKIATIRLNSGFIRGIPVNTAA